MKNKNQIGMIAAIDKDGLIGCGDKIVWKKPADQKRFKSLTMGGTVIVGSTTWKGIQPRGLPGRFVIVVSKSPVSYFDSLITGAHMYSTSLTDAIGFAQLSDNPIWIIGGAQIYKQGFEYADFIDLTVINQSHHIDDPSKAVYFPEIPNYFNIEIEAMNQDDPDLMHYRYIRSNETEKTSSSSANSNAPYIE